MRKPHREDESPRLRPPQRHELESLAQLALADQPASRRRLVAAPVREALEQSSGAGGESRVLDAGGERAVVVATRSGDAAQILAVGATAPERLARRALLAVHERLEYAGVRFVQAMRRADQRDDLLVACGYHDLATLDYLVHDGTESARLGAPEGASAGRGRSVSARLRFLPVRSSEFDLFSRITEATYRYSLDCPGLDGMRTASETLGGYRRAAGYDPAGWFVARLGEEPVGCLVTTPHAAAGTLELTYMGLIPRARGNGLGRELLAQACCHAAAVGLPQVLLAVDQRNAPARKLYRGAGFEWLMSERTWCRRLGAAEQPLRIRRAG